MRMASQSAHLLLGLSLFTLGADAGWPIKTIDLSDRGNNCDTSKEHYLQVEGYDYHDHPKFTMRWRQITGPCGAAVDDSELLQWEASYDGTSNSAPDDPPTEGDAGRVQLNIFMCAPFGEYELDMDVESFSDEGSDLEQRTSWEIENGPDEYHIWDTVNTNLADVEEYSPTVNGQYTWPLQGETGYYKTLYAGPLPPLECSSSVPPGTEFVGCFADSSRGRLLNSDDFKRDEQGPDGMTGQLCSSYCSAYDFFGLEFGSECFCGTAEEFEHAETSEDCGKNFESLCTGDATTACGGRNAISVYKRTGVVPPPTPTPNPTPTPDVEVLTPAPVATPAPTEAPLVAPTSPTPDASAYELAGCYADSKRNRLMGDKMSKNEMSAEICFGLCNDGRNTHFGTQYASECWCEVDAHLTKVAPKLALSDCDFLCKGTTTGEYCGGHTKMTAYTIGEGAVPPDDGGGGGGDTLNYIGCYRDKRTRAMDKATHESDEMTNELCVEFCGSRGHDFAGTQYAKECWCGDSPGFARYGEISEDECDFTCTGEHTQDCGGFYALSVYET